MNLKITKILQFWIGLIAFWAQSVTASHDASFRFRPHNTTVWGKFFYTPYWHKDTYFKNPKLKI